MAYWRHMQHREYRLSLSSPPLLLLVVLVASGFPATASAQNPPNRAENGSARQGRDVADQRMQRAEEPEEVVADGDGIIGIEAFEVYEPPMK